MKLLEQNDYTQLFFRAIQYDTREKITAYFKGKYNEEKECNPLELFIDGVNKAYNGFSGQFQQILHDEKRTYYLLCSKFPDYKKPDINEHKLPCINIDKTYIGHYTNLDIERIKEGFDEFVRAERSKEYPKIEKLDLDSLEHSDIVAGYYENNWKFSNVKHQDGIYNIPILESALALISDKKQMKFPWEAYVKGFCNEYLKPITKKPTTTKEREWLLRSIQPNPFLPSLSYQPNEEAYFSEEKAAEYGAYNAKAYRTWEIVIEELPTFEEIFKGEKENKEEQPATTDLPVEPKDYSNTAKPLSDVAQKTDLLKDWIKSDYITNFSEIENELLKRGFIDASFKWIKSKRKLIEFLLVIEGYRFFKGTVLGEKKQSFHYRQFISERYGYGKTGLTETNKKYKTDVELAKATFFWIKKPD